MHPQNVFGEAILLFVTGIVLIVRDRGSAVASTPYDTLIGSLLILFSICRLSEMIGGSRDGHIFSRSIVWLMWVLPIILFAWLLYQYRRLDLGILLAVSVAALIGVTIYLVSGSGGFDIIAPDGQVGASSGVYMWIRTDGKPLFLSFGFYILLTIALIYLTIISFLNRTYWLLVGLLVLGYAIAALCIPQITKNPLGTLGSLTSLVMLGLGVFTVLLVPG